MPLQLVVVQSHRTFWPDSSSELEESMPHSPLLSLPPDQLAGLPLDLTSGADISFPLTLLSHCWSLKQQQSLLFRHQDHAPGGNYCLNHK